MTYRRVIPRDLFNEANLLKCLGALYISLDGDAAHFATFVQDDLPSFIIEQNMDDGSISVVNIGFHIKGVPYELIRPLNSRRPWPLYCRDLTSGADDVPVFTEQGTLTMEFTKLIRG